MGKTELYREWEKYRARAEQEYGEWDQKRLEAVGPHLDALNEFLAGESDLAVFRTKIDSLSKTEPLWGFRGTSQMFFNQLVKAADPSALDAAFKQILPAPGDEAEAKEKLERFLTTVEAARDRAESTGASKPDLGRINAFSSFFWELQDRDEWPNFFPNSRRVLESHGLLDVEQRQPELYLEYRATIQDLKSSLDATTWDVEHLLWHLGQGAAKESEEAPAEAPAATSVAAAATDLYAGYRQQGLHFPDEVVTSLLLSLATKRFVILSGISGTGKTQIALGLARYLESVDSAPPVATEPPRQDPDNIYIRLTAPKLQRGSVSLISEARAHVDRAVGLPARGESQFYETRLPDGSQHRMRLNNVDLASSRDLYRLYLRKDIAEWLQANANPGDYLHLAVEPAEGIDFALDVVSGTTAQDDEQTSRHATIAIRSDWTDPRGLLGYFNPLTSSYVRTDLVELLLRAGDDPERPYLVILDEMNLARVEYYFSDFLSALESAEPITLMSPGAADENAANQESSDVELPAELAIPPNVSFIGTVNVDETTHAFSPKVLDRANVIEFGDVDVRRALGRADAGPAAGLKLEAALDPTWLCTPRQVAMEPKATAHGRDDFVAAIEDVHEILSWSNLQFGYRVIDEMSAFVGHAIEKAAGESEQLVRAALDLQIRQKIVPKLSGGRELEEPLARLLHYCLDGRKLRAVEVDSVRSAAVARLGDGAASPRYPGAADKLARMLDRLAYTGFVGALE